MYGTGRHSGSFTVSVCLCQARQRQIVQASVHPRTQTPLVATALTVATSGVCALLVDLEVLADLVSVGILVCFLLVCAAAIWRRYTPPHAEFVGRDAQWGLSGNVSAIVATALATSAAYVGRAPAWICAVCFGAPPHCPRGGNASIAMTVPWRVLLHWHWACRWRHVLAHILHAPSFAWHGDRRHVARAAAQHSVSDIAHASS